MLPERLRAALARLASRVHLVLGVALGGAALGALGGAFLPAPPEPLLPETAPWVDRLVFVASGAFMGWWLGLIAGIAHLAFRRRR